MKHTGSQQSFQSDNSKLLQAWYNLETVLRDTSINETTVSNFHVSQQQKPVKSNLYSQYAEFQKSTADSASQYRSAGTLNRPLTAMSNKSIGLSNFKSKDSIPMRPQTATLAPPKRPLTAFSNLTGRPQTTISEQPYVDISKMPTSQVASVKSLLKLKATSRPHLKHGAENIHVPKDDLNLISGLNDHEIDQVIENSEYIHTLKVDMLLDLYNAKCVDTRQRYQPQHAVMFVEKVKKMCLHQNFSIQECQLGYQSALVMKALLVKNTHFSRLSLSKNNLGDLGLVEVGKILLRNHNIVHLDVSSNNITPDGAHSFFQLASKTRSLVSVDISSKDGLNRNKVGVYGCEPLESLLKSDHPLQFLDVKGTSIGTTGLECILAGLQHNESLVYLNVAHNDLGQDACLLFETYLESTALEELVLSSNPIGNQGMDNFSALFVKPAFRLKRINLASCRIKSLGALKLLSSLASNVHLEQLILDDNWFTGNGFNQIEAVLNSKCPLEYLSLVGCQISTAGAEMIGSGLQKNRSLKTLILRCNRIGDSGGEAIAAGMNLETLDLSSCALGDNSALHLANLLTESTEIRKVLLADNNFHDSAGALIVEATRKNPRLQHVDLAQNPLGYRYQEDVRKNLQRNQFHQNANRVPEYSRKVEELTEFESQKFVIVHKEMLLQEQQRENDQELHSLTEQKAQLRATELHQTEALEKEFMEMLQYSRNLDKHKDRMEIEQREEGNLLDDNILELKRLQGNTMGESNAFEKDIRFMKDHLQVRKQQLDSKVEWMKRDLLEKKRIATNVETGYKSFENQLTQLRTKIAAAEKKLQVHEPDSKTPLQSPRPAEQQQPGAKQPQKKQSQKQKRSKK